MKPYPPSPLPEMGAVISFEASAQGKMKAGPPSLSALRKDVCRSPVIRRWRALQ